MRRAAKDIDLPLRRESNRAITIVRPWRSACPSALLTSGRLPCLRCSSRRPSSSCFSRLRHQPHSKAPQKSEGASPTRHGAVLPGVTVVLTNEDTGVFRETISGADGSYFASQLIPGRYRIVAKLGGFRTLERPGLVLQLGTTLTINLTLEVGPHQETVTVASTTPLIDLASTQVGGNIGTAELTELPAINRSYFATVALLPGIQFTATNQLGNDTIVASGQASQNNNVSVDGGYNTDDAVGASFGAQVRTPLEAIQESQVVTSMYGAEYGRAGAAIVNVVTRQGTNTFRGVAFAHAAGDRLTAKDFVAKEGNLPKPEVTKREWGFVARRSNRQKQGAFLLQSRAASGQAEPHPGVFHEALAQLLDCRGSHELEHAYPVRSPDQRESHLGDPLAARGRASASDCRRAFHPGDLRGRDRPRSDDGRHPDERVRKLTRQHVPCGEDLGALLAGQRMLPRSGRER